MVAEQGNGTAPIVIPCCVFRIATGNASHTLHRFQPRDLRYFVLFSPENPGVFHFFLVSRDLYRDCRAEDRNCRGSDKAAESLRACNKRDGQTCTAIALCSRQPPLRIRRWLLMRCELTFSMPQEKIWAIFQILLS